MSRRRDLEDERKRAVDRIAELRRAEDEDAETMADVLSFRQQIAEQEQEIERIQREIKND
jgi:hypothetical protein